MILENCYLIFAKDFKKRNWADWIKTQICLAPPPFRFKGHIAIEYDGILFEGYDAYENSNTEFKINKESIRQLYYGYDNVFNKFETKGFGISYAPIRITIENNNNKEAENLYIISDFNGIFSADGELFETLKKWLS